MSCPLCDTADRYKLRHFPGQPPSYVLCKWCGYRRNLADGPEDFTLAIPVMHRHADGKHLLTWMEYGPTDRYRDLTWTCDCGVTLRVWHSLRPYPRFAGPNEPRELPDA